MIDVIHFSDTITLGAVIVGVLAGLAGLATFAYGVRWKTNAEVADATIDTLKEALVAERGRGDRLKDEAQEQRELKHREINEHNADRLKLESALEIERAKTDLTGLMQQFQAQHLELMTELHSGRHEAVGQVAGQLQRHEDRAIARHEEVVLVLKEIVTQLQNGGH